MQLINVALRRHAAPAPARALRPPRAPPRGRLASTAPTTMSRCDEGSLAARAAGEAQPRDQVPPPPGRRPAGRGPAGQRRLGARRSAPRRSSCPDTALRARRAVAPGGGHGEPGRRRARAGGAPSQRAPAALGAGHRQGVRRARPYTPPQCGCRADQGNRLGGGGRGRRRAAAAQAGRRAAARHPDGRLRRAARRCASPCAARARATWRCARCRCGRTWPRTSPRTTTSGAGASACTSTIRSTSTACSGSASCRPCACSARSPGCGPSGAPNGGRSIACSCGRTGRGSWCRTARSLYILVRQPERFPRAAVMTYAVFDIGASVYWLAPTAPPWYAASVAGRERGRRRAEDVRRMMVEYGEHVLERRLGAALQCVRRQSPGCDALAALRHIRDGRAPARRGGAGGGRARLAYAAMLGFALVYLGEHYVVDLLAGAALTGAVRRLGPRAGPAIARRTGRGGAGGDGPRGGPERDEEVSETRDGASGSVRGGRRGRRRRSWGHRTRDARSRCSMRRPGTAAHHEEEMPRVVITRRRAIAFGVFVLAVVGFLYFVLPKLAGVGTTLHHLEHGDGWWIAIGVRARAAVVRRLRGAVPRRVRAADVHPPGPIGWRESYQITMAGLAATRLFATAGAGGRGADGLGAAPLGDGGAAGGLPDGRVHRAAVRRLRGLGADRRDRPGDRPVPRRRLVRADDRARRSWRRS